MGGYSFSNGSNHLNRILILTRKKCELVVFDYINKNYIYHSVDVINQGVKCNTLKYLVYWLARLFPPDQIFPLFKPFEIFRIGQHFFIDSLQLSKVFVSGNDMILINGSVHIIENLCWYFILTLKPIRKFFASVRSPSAKLTYMRAENLSICLIRG